MRGHGRSRKRITFNYSRQFIRIPLLICLLVSVAAFATSRDILIVKAREATPSHPQPAAATVPIQAKPSPVPGQTTQKQPNRTAVAPNSKPKTEALANVQPFTESTSFRLLWVGAGFGFIYL